MWVSSSVIWIIFGTQIVNANQVDSAPLNISCGVPQGRIIGPLLLLCYVNDIPITTDYKHGKVLLYVNESVLMVSGKALTCVVGKLSQELDSCS